MVNEDFGVVVLVDGSKTQMELLKAAFGECKTECVCIENAKASLNFFKKSARIDAIVIDWMSINLDIFDYLQQIRQLSSCTNARIVVLGSGSMTANIRESLLSRGADYYMIKPYKADTLLCCLKALRPVYHLPVTTIWDAMILRKLENLPISTADVSFWYISSCLQQWLMCETIPQLKSVFIKVGQQFHISSKGVESGVNRAIRSIAKSQKISPCPTCKEWITNMADNIRFEYQNESRGDCDAGKPKRAE